MSRDRGLAGVVDRRRSTPFSRYFTKARREEVDAEDRQGHDDHRRREDVDPAPSAERRVGLHAEQEADDDQDDRRQQDREQPHAGFAEEQPGLAEGERPEHWKSPEGLGASWRACDR